MSKIAVVLPTRNRPERLEKFISSAFEKCNDIENIRFYLYIDLDDEITVPKVQELNERYGKRIGFIVGPRTMMSQTANALLPYIQKEEIFYLGADDLIIRTPDWDKLIIEFFDQHHDKIVLGYGHDGLQPELATHPILHRRWVECVGYLTPPYFESDFADTWINHLAALCGNRKQRIEFYNEHMHYFAGKSEADQTFIENRNRYKFQDPQLVFNCLRPVMERDARRLLGLIESLKND